MSRIKGWTKLSSEALWATWLQQFNTETEAVSTAIWIANRLVKDRAPSTRRKFYSLKDEFLMQHREDLVQGSIARRETETCRRCGGTGRKLITGGKCRDCRTTGIYVKQILYLHEFVIEGQRYSFHSYLKPERLNPDALGADLERYGGRFTQDELREMALPLSGLLRLLGYYACTHWGMQFDKSDGTYWGGWTTVAALKPIDPAILERMIEEAEDDVDDPALGEALVYE